MKRSFDKFKESEEQNAVAEKKKTKLHHATFTLSSRPRIRFKGSGIFPFFRKPVEVGCLSLDIKRQFYNDKRQLKYYIAPNRNERVNFDLRIGYQHMIQKDEESEEFINDILRWITYNKDKFMLESEKQQTNRANEKRDLHTDFICWRGLLTKLLCTPFEQRDGWKIAVTRYNGTFYMCEFDTESRIRQKNEMTDRQKEMCYWGWKFEQYVTADKPGGVPNTTVPVNNCEAFCTVVRSRLEKHSMLFSGEVDAVDPNSTEKCKYVEFKTTRQIDNHRQERNFIKFKLIKWWAQSFLVGIPTIICGYRNDDGVVHSLEKMDVSKIPQRTKDEEDGWDPVVCFNFLDAFFSFVKENVKIDDPRTVHLLTWQPPGDIICELQHPGSKYQFLPEWYINQSE